ncbi:hypothetical protein KSF_096240 [Reticulibacter mediterranei]|uniref:DUF2269 domain-containing protein n=1 Tax=Reticulibacter mediterranei TaxID=2778369 RepID=A0A8J3J2I3_9CHLR|nr:DUF2269 family protein [Reticulibacter mediterranei]GHO99576.1 hypothetical protein KSF_096240 [Reticulibacter mediterranei]
MTIMALYPYALLVHIVGIVGLCVAVSLEAATAFRLRAAKTTVQVREWMFISTILEKLLPISAVLVLLSGLYMILAVWGWGHAWIDLSLCMLVALGIGGAVINSPRMKAIHQALAAAPDGPIIDDPLKQLIADPVLWMYAQIPGFMALAAIVLMVLKLDWPGSIAVLIVALVLGLVSAQLSKRTSRNAQQQAAPDVA